MLEVSREVSKFQTIYSNKVSNTGSHENLDFKLSRVTNMYSSCDKLRIKSLFLNSERGDTDLHGRFEFIMCESSPILMVANVLTLSYYWLLIILDSPKILCLP